MPLSGLPIIVMTVLYTSRKQVKLQRACACGDPEIHVCKSSLFAPVVLHIELHGCKSWGFAPVPESSCADSAFQPLSSCIDVVTYANQVYLPTSPFHGCCPEQRQEPAQLGASQFAAGYDDIGRAARKALILSKITTFRVVKTTTLISVK